MNGTNAVSSAILMTDPSWIVLRVADFDGDGKKDLLWHNTSTGQTAIWLMNGLTASTGAPSSTPIPIGWSLTPATSTATAS